MAAVAHTFNDDLLANQGDGEQARTLYPDIAHVLDDPDLRQLFNSYDEPAKGAKRRSRSIGFQAVGMVTLSLLFVAAEPVLHHLAQSRPVLAEVIEALVYVSVFFAIVGTAWGFFGLLFRKAKSDWLLRRLMTERLRMLHFQTLVCRIPEIARSVGDPEAARKYGEERKVWLAQFIVRHKGKLAAELDTILEGGERDDFWLHPKPSHDPANAEQAPASLFAAYRDLRIVHQLQYATYKLGEGDTFLPSLPHRQAKVFSLLSMLAVLVIVGLHIVIGLGVGLGSNEFLITILGSIAICVAIFALAIRTLEEGLQPEREVERYRKYQSAVRAIRDRFDHAITNRERLMAMADMERLVFDEMCDFMETHAKARFVM